jgi:hypothetical protein
MSAYILLPPAREDLLQIWEYTSGSEAMTAVVPMP